MKAKSKKETEGKGARKSTKKDKKEDKKRRKSSSSSSQSSAEDDGEVAITNAIGAAFGVNLASLAFVKILNKIRVLKR